MMKTLITAVAVTAALATPSFAQTRHQVPPRKPNIGSYGSFGTIGRPPGLDIGSYGSFGTIGPRTAHRSPYSVYSIRGNYIGADPDPRIRDQLRRDPTQGGSGR
jgi:hypothetical protein